MAQLSMNEMTTYRWSFEEDVQNYVAAGITSIGVWRDKLADFGETKGIELLRDCGLRVSSLHWAGGFTGSDGRSFKESVADARGAIELASEMNAECIVVYSGSRAGHTHNHARRLFKTALSQLQPVARDVGVTLAVEPMHVDCGTNWTFLTKMDQALELIGEVDAVGVKLAFDTYHFGGSPEAVEQLGHVVPHLALVQLGDAKELPCPEPNRCRLGEGVIPLADILATLKQNGYDGPVEVKLMGEEIEASDYRELIAHSREAFEELTGAAAA